MQLRVFMIAALLLGGMACQIRRPWGHPHRHTRPASTALPPPAHTEQAPTQPALCW